MYIPDIKFDTSLIAQQINELEETVKAMRATLFLVCRGRLLEKQIGNVKTLKELNLEFDLTFSRTFRKISCFVSNYLNKHNFNYNIFTFPF